MDEPTLDDRLGAIQMPICSSNFEHLMDTSSDDDNDDDGDDCQEDDGGQLITKNTDLNDNLNSETNNEPSSSQTFNIPRNKPSTDDDADQVVLSMVISKGALGAAYYNIKTTELFVMDDTVEDDYNYKVTKALFKQCQPEDVLLISGTSESFINMVKKLIVEDDSHSMSSKTSQVSAFNHYAGASLKLLKKSENSYENCYNRVKCFKLNNEPENLSNSGRLAYLNSVLNFKSRLMIHSLGLLLRYLDENWSKMVLDTSRHAQFSSVHYVTLKDLVMIEEDTYKALNIMQSRFHPSLFKFGTTSKGQGMSLFTLLNRCQSRPGSQFLWKLMRYPTNNIETLKERFKAIEFFINSDNQNTVQTLKLCLKKLLRLSPSVINKYSSIQAAANDWIKLHMTLCSVIQIAEISNQHKNSAQIFSKISTVISEEMQNIRYFIDYIVDLDASKKLRKFTVKRGVDPFLDRLTDKKQSLPFLLTEMATKELEKLPNIIETCRMIYVPDIQFCLAVTNWNGEQPEDDEIPELEFKFSINGIRHYKCEGARELDRTIGDILLKITQRQSQIMLRLAQYTSKQVGSILKAIECCAELDALLSLASVSQDFDYVKPEVLNVHMLRIINGRHPLKELTANFVANDMISGDGSSLVKIFTGPNACGKTVYLKQTALIVYMAHIGCFVPAESATIGVVTHILAQMASIETIAHNASSFLMDLRQINTIIHSSTPNSLILMDEFGKGTSEFDAFALLTGILTSFIEREDNCPHILVATHQHKVVEFLPKSPIAEAKTFEFILNDDDSLTFLYRLIPGNVQCSFAHAAAKSAGLSSEIIQRSIQVFESIKKGEVLESSSAKLHRENAIKRLKELVSKNGENFNFDEVKFLVRQAMAKRL